MTVSCTSVHGNVVIAENISGGALDTVGGAAYTDRVGQSYGWGKTFQFVGGYGRENWFHIPVPTLGVLDGSDMFLDRFDVLFVTEGDCAVDGVDYWNSWGATSASRFESIQRGPFRGDWSFAHE